MRGKAWTGKELQFLKDNVEMRNKDLAEALGRTERAVSHKKCIFRVKEDERYERAKQIEKEYRIKKLAYSLGVRLVGESDV